MSLSDKFFFACLLFGISCFIGGITSEFYFNPVAEQRFLEKAAKIGAGNFTVDEWGQVYFEWKNK